MRREPTSSDETGAEGPAGSVDRVTLESTLARLVSKRPTLGARILARIGTSSHPAALASRLGSRPAEGRIACECADVSFGEIDETVDRGAVSLPQVVAATGLGTGVCAGRRCLDDVALLLARATGRAAAELRAEVDSLMFRLEPRGAALELARVAHAHARAGDDPFIEDEDEPEVVVRGARGRP